MIDSTLNNISDINIIINNKKFDLFLDKVDKNKVINIPNNLIHTKPLSHKEQLIFNLDSYITFLKSKLFINQFELRYIIELTIYNKYSKILLSDIYYYNDTNYYNNEFIKMFMYNYLKNYRFLSKYIKIKKRNFNELVNLLNKHKKRTYIYFEDINVNNMNFYIPLILNFENTNS